MDNNLFKLMIPVIIFLVLLIDIKNSLEIYSGSEKDIKKFKIAKIFILIALFISAIVGILNFINRPLNNKLNYYITMYNVLVLVIYLLFTRFKNFRRAR